MRSLIFPIGVVIAVTVVLLQGVYDRQSELERVRPDEGLQEPPPTAPRIRSELEKTPLSYVSDFWLQLAQRAQGHLVRIGERGMPAVIVAPGLAVTSLAAGRDLGAAQLASDGSLLDPAPAATPDGASPPDGSDVSLLGVDPDLGLSVFAVAPGGDPAPPPSNPEPMHSGSQIAAVTLNSDGEPRVVPGYLASTARPITSLGYRTLDLSIDWPTRRNVFAIIDLDGGLLGVAIDTREGRRILTAVSATTIAENLRNDGVCQSIEVADLDEAARALLRVSDGVLVERVRPEAFVPEPSVRPGDVLLRWDGVTVESTEQFARLYRATRPGALVRYMVRRQQRRVTGGTHMPSADCRPVAEPPLRLTRLGVTLEWRSPAASVPGDEGWVVTDLTAEGLAVLSGVQLGDRIVELARQALTRENAAARFAAQERGSQALLLTIVRSGRTRLIVVDASESR